MAVSDSRVFGTTVSGLETVSHLITRYAKFERVYLQRDAQAFAEIELFLTTLYAELLTFLAKAIKYFKTSTGGE